MAVEFCCFFPLLNFTKHFIAILIFILTNPLLIIIQQVDKRKFQYTLNIFFGFLISIKAQVFCPHAIYSKWECFLLQLYHNGELSVKLQLKIKRRHLILYVSVNYYNNLKGFPIGRTLTTSHKILAITFHIIYKV